MQENKARCGPTGENAAERIFLQGVFEVQKAHRDLYPLVGSMMVFPPGNRVKNSP
jgi:hypothetical protein